MTISFAKSVRVPEDVMVREMDGESVLLNLASERYYSLDEVGTRVWGLVTTTESIQAAYDALLAEYEVEPAVLHQDMEALLTSLADNGLIAISD